METFPEGSGGNGRPGVLRKGTKDGPEKQPQIAVAAAWARFIAFCEEMRFGEIERLKIQDGLPVLAEVTKKKIKFTT